MANPNFFIPTTTQKVSSRQPVETFSYLEHTGNLPDKRKFTYVLPEKDVWSVRVQTFEAEYTSIKAIGLYFKSNYRPEGQLRKGAVKLFLYEEGSPHTLLGSVRVDINQINDLTETIFEFRNEIEVTVGSDYFFYVVQTEGYNDNEPIQMAINAEPLASGDVYTWDGNTGNALVVLDPPSNFVFEVYRSITTLAVEVVGPKGKSLSDVYDSLTTGPNALEPEYGIADYVKTFAYNPDTSASPHAQLYIDNTSPTPSKIGDGGTISGNWSDSSDLSATLADHYDIIQISTTERVRVDWDDSDYATPDCSSNFRLLAEGDVLTLNELVDTINFRLHQSGDTPPEISMTFWKIVPPLDEE